MLTVRPFGGTGFVIALVPDRRPVLGLLHPRIGVQSLDIAPRRRDHAVRGERLTHPRVGGRFRMPSDLGGRPIARPATAVESQVAGPRLFGPHPIGIRHLSPSRLG
ncbi:hypothetical protein ACWKSP_33400 [Micromonosporaceae bacterium Da 78-11]